MPLRLLKVNEVQPMREPGSILLCGHTGTSMNPTLNATDLLEVKPYGDRMPRSGDVILCTPQGRNQPVVHRIVRVSSNGIITRGDNSSEDDDWKLLPSNIIGRVIAACRGKKRRVIKNGYRGILTAYFIRLRKGFRRALIHLLRPVYHQLIKVQGRTSKVEGRTF